MKRVVLLFLVLLTVNAQAVELNIDERMKRKVVSRMYQTTEIALRRCPQQDIDDFEESFTTFKKVYPEFNSLLENSIYRKYAEDNFAYLIQESRKESARKLSGECLYLKSLLDSLVTTESGKKWVEEMVGLFKKKL